MTTKTTTRQPHAGRQPDRGGAARQAQGPARARQRVPQRLPAHAPGRRAARGVRGQDQRGAGAGGDARGRGRPHDAQARDGQGELRHAPGHVRAHPALHHARRRGRGHLRSLQALGPGRHPGRRGHAVPHQDRRAFHQGRAAAAARQVAAPAAGEVPRPGRPGAEVSPALSRPHHQRGHAPGVRGALAGRSRRSASSSSRAAISKSKRP